MTKQGWQAIRLQALQRDHYTCQRCGKTTENCSDIIEVHHIIARQKEGPDGLNNLKVYCRKCHKIIEPAWSLYNGISSINPHFKTVAISNELHQELNKIGLRGESFENIIRRCVDYYKKGHKINN